jgi:Mn-dependent DtxR family transcriptional regulator
MGVKASPATSTVQKLSELGMLGYTPYRAVTLTPEGRRVTLGMLVMYVTELFVAV